MSGALDGLRVLATGGAPGIGLATALACQAAGAQVAVMDLPDPPATDPPAADPSASGGPASGGLAAGELVGVRADVTGEGAVAAGVEDVARQFGGLDSLVNSAGIGALTLAMAADHLTGGVRVDCVNPGTVDTPWVRRLLGQAADPAARSTTGTALAIDGGMDALRLRSGGGQS